LNIRVEGKFAGMETGKILLQIMFKLSKPICYELKGFILKSLNPVAVIFGYGSTFIWNSL